MKKLEVRREAVFKEELYPEHLKMQYIEKGLEMKK